MDEDVRKAVRTLEHTKLQGLSLEEIKRFIVYSAESYLQEVRPFEIGDKIKWEADNFTRYGYITEVPSISFKAGYGAPKIDWGEFKMAISGY